MAAEALTQSQAVRLEVLIVYDWSNSPFVFLIWIVDLRYGEVQTVNTWATFRPGRFSASLVSDAEIVMGSEW